MASGGKKKKNDPEEKKKLLKKNTTQLHAAPGGFERGGEAGPCAVSGKMAKTQMVKKALPPGGTQSNRIGCGSGWGEVSSAGSGGVSQGFQSLSPRVK